jgi:hypothetical protein
MVSLSLPSPQMCGQKPPPVVNVVHQDDEKRDKHTVHWALVDQISCHLPQATQVEKERKETVNENDHEPFNLNN